MCCLWSVTNALRSRAASEPFLAANRAGAGRSPPTAEVRPLPNWRLPGACSQGRTCSGHGDSEITRLNCRGFSKQASLPPPPCPHSRDGPLVALRISFDLYLPTQQQRMGEGGWEVWLLRPWTGAWFASCFRVHRSRLVG